MNNKRDFEYNDNIAVINFAVPSYAHIIGTNDVAKFYPKRDRNTSKSDYGSANIVAGSNRYIGAAALSCAAALRSGCGYVKLTSTEKVKLALAARYAQVIFLDDIDLRSQAIAIGMGSGISEELYNTIKYLVENYDGTLIIDADGLNSLSKFGVGIIKNARCKIILTPHAVEFSRLTGKTVKSILSSPVELAQEFAQNFGVIMHLKGAASIISDGQKVFINVSGTTALAKAGSGDMLSGYMAGSAARGLAPFDAAVCAAHTMGIAAVYSTVKKTDYCATAHDILNNLHFAVKYLTEKN